MQLSIPKFFHKEKKEKNLFWALEIGDNFLKAAACEISGGKMGLLGTGTEEYDGNWDNAIIACDKIISGIEENLPGQNLDKVILGLPMAYVNEGKIRPEYLAQIKSLCQKLSLIPLGFVEIPLAMANFLKTENNGPESLVLVRLGQKLEVSLIRVGKVTNNIVLERSGNLSLDLENSLKSFSDVEVLPSKILLYGADNLEAAKQELMSYPWTSRASFLHFPKIEIGEADLDLKSVSFAGGTEMGTVETVGGDRGNEGEQEKIESGPEIVEGDNFGFAKTPVLVTEEVKEKFKLAKPKLNLPKIVLPSVILPKKFVLILGTLGILGCLVIMGLFFWFWPKATVSLILKSKTLEQPLEITLNSQLPAINFEVQESSSQKISTTGKKTVGEKAKGTVTIYNKIQNNKTFKAGTVIISPTNLKFTLDNDVTVASGSDPTVFGKVDATVTAVNFGTDGNLGAGQIFQFSDYTTDSYAAKNGNSFGGGTSRQISVVAGADREKLLTDLTQTLTKKGKSDLLTKLSSGEQLLEETLEGTVGSKIFDKDVNEEGTDLSLNLKMNFSALGYKNSDLTGILEKTAGKTIPPNYQIDQNSIKMETADWQKDKNGQYRLKTDFKLLLLPKIDQNIVKKNLLGKNLTLVDNYLRATANIAGYEIHFNRQLPFLKFMPHTLSNLAIETSWSLE